MRLRLPVHGFERHIHVFYLLHVSVPLKGEGREVQQTASTRHEMQILHVANSLRSALVLTFAAGIITPCIPPRRAADRKSSIPTHSSTPALGTSSLEFPSSSLFSNPPLCPVSANAPVYIQPENVALPIRLQPFPYRKGRSSKQKERDNIANKSPGGKKHKQVDVRGWCRSPSEGAGGEVTRRAKSSFTLTPRHTLSCVRTQAPRTWISSMVG